MVHDHIDYAKEYFNLAPGIRRALEFLAATDLAKLEPGRHDVEGDDVFALVSDYVTKLPEETFWEAHRRHIDVQFVVRGRERIGYGNLATFACEPYDASRDLVVAHGESSRFVEVNAGEFVVLWPHDVHMPGLRTASPHGDGESQPVRKVVVKVRITSTSVAAVP